MESIGNVLFRTVSCRTSRLFRPIDPTHALLCCTLLGVVIGTLLACEYPEAAASPLLTQGLCVTETVRTLWDVFCAAAFPVLLLLMLEIAFSGWSIGQPFLLCIPVIRGAAAGIAAADCFSRYDLRTGTLAAAALILPYALCSVFLLINPLKEALSLSCCMTAYLLRGSADPDIASKYRRYCISVLRYALLTLLAAGAHTALLWVMSDRLLTA